MNMNMNMNINLKLMWKIIWYNRLLFIYLFLLLWFIIEIGHAEGGETTVKAKIEWSKLFWSVCKVTTVLICLTGSLIVILNIPTISNNFNEIEKRLEAVESVVVKEWVVRQVSSGKVIDLSKMENGKQIEEILKVICEKTGE